MFKEETLHDQVLRINSLNLDSTLLSTGVITQMTLEEFCFLVKSKANSLKVFAVEDGYAFLKSCVFFMSINIKH